MAACTFVTSLSARAAPADINAAEAAALFGLPAVDVDLGPMSTSPPAAEVRVAGKLLGYVFSTHAVAGSIGYSGKPLDVHVGLRLDGRIAGARLSEHQEPILVIGVAPAALDAFVAGRPSRRASADGRPQ
jgi:transcriptional regulator of nitric oxide reductase